MQSFGNWCGAARVVQVHVSCDVNGVAPSGDSRRGRAADRAVGKESRREGRAVRDAFSSWHTRRATETLSVQLYRGTPRRDAAVSLASVRGLRVRVVRSGSARARDRACVVSRVWAVACAIYLRSALWALSASALWRRSRAPAPRGPGPRRPGTGDAGQRTLTVTLRSADSQKTVIFSHWAVGTPKGWPDR